MAHIRKISLLTVALVGLSACMSERSMDRDSGGEYVTITHTTKGTLYWE